MAGLIQQRSYLHQRLAGAVLLGYTLQMFQQGLITEKSGNIFPGGCLYFLISPGSPHVRCTPMGRTCGEPDEIELTAIGVDLHGSRRVPEGDRRRGPRPDDALVACSRQKAARRRQKAAKGGTTHRVGVFSLVSSAHPHVRCTPMGRACRRAGGIELTPPLG